MSTRPTDYPSNIFGAKNGCGSVTPLRRTEDAWKNFLHHRLADAKEIFLNIQI